MRYGQPSIDSVLKKLRDQGVEELTVLPLYPQFSGTTTASIYDAVDQSLQTMKWQPRVFRIEEYHQHPAWVKAVADSITNFRQQHGAAEKLLFSMHGIPQRYVRQGDPYEQQCKAGIAAIVKALGLEDDEWLLSFQSRVGREPWLQPYTDKTLELLASQGVKHVQVVCPGFAVDCLETLEEIAMENRELFEEKGGEKLEYIAALNDSDSHVKVLASLVADHG
jgi:ferrochelatase